MSKTTVFTLQNVPEEYLGRSIVRASLHESPSCECVRRCLAALAPCRTEYVDLCEALPVELRIDAPEASVGIVRDAPNTLWGDATVEAMEREFDAQAHAVNKHEFSRRHVRDSKHPKGVHDGVVQLRMRWHI